MRSWLRLGATAVVAVAATGAFGSSGDATTAMPGTGTATAGTLTVSRFGKGAAENRAAKIVVARGDGSQSRVLTTGWLSFVSSDGTQVAVVDSDVNWFTNQRLELYATSGGAPRRVIPLGCVHLYWSPDSTKLACVEVVRAGRPARLRLIDAETGTKTTLATGYFDDQVSFSPDSTFLAYVQKPTEGYFSSLSTLRVIELGTQAVRTLRGGGVASPAWGPTEIAFATLLPRGRNFTLDVAVIRPDGSGFRRLTRFRPTAELYGPHPVVWSADGTRLLAGMVGLDAWTFRESYAVDPIKGGVRLIAHGVSPSVLTRDGGYVIGQTGDAESTGLAGSNVVRVPWTGGTKRVLLRRAVEPSSNG